MNINSNISPSNHDLPVVPAGALKINRLVDNAIASGPTLPSLATVRQEGHRPTTLPLPPAPKE